MSYNILKKTFSLPKLFSLNDISEKYMSKGPLIRYSTHKRILEEYSKTSKGRVNDILYANNNTTTKRLSKLKKTNSALNINIYNNNKFKLPPPEGRITRLYKPILWENIDVKILKKQRDPYMPMGLEFFEKNIKEYRRNIFSTNPNISRQTKLKMNMSNIFNLDNYNKIYNNNLKSNTIETTNNTNDNKILTNTNKFKITKTLNNPETVMSNTRNKMKSDIFLIHPDDPEIVKKSGEKCYFRGKKKFYENENIYFPRNGDICEDLCSIGRTYGKKVFENNKKIYL